MPLTLHPHLKRRLDSSELYTDPKDGMERILPDNQDAQEQAAKRRRVEAIAAQYLRGKPPVILSAGLRGPFNNGWKNPWGRDMQATRATSGRQIRTSEQRRVRSAHNTNRAPSPSKAKITKSHPKVRARHTKWTASPSPEASRAVRDDYEVNAEDDSLEEVEVPPATALSPEAPDASDNMSIHNRSPITDSFWLRRPASQRQAATSRAANENVDVSPIQPHIRKGGPQLDSRRSLRLAPAKAPLPKRSQLKTITPGDWRSSASASMIISSPVRGQDKASEPSVTMPECSHPDSSHKQVFLQNNRSRQTSVQPDTSSTGSQGRPSREDIQRSAERLVNIMAASSGSIPHPEKSNQKRTREGVSKKALKHDLIASPALSSSSGFVYRKFGDGKQTNSNASRSVPRAIDFNSPHMPQDHVFVLERHGEQNMASTEETVASGNKSPTCEIVPNHEPSLQHSCDKGIETAGHRVQEQDGTSHSSPISQLSTFSTQAAMLLAQMEFHESPCSATSPVTPRPWLLSPDQTPRSVLPVHSPAITPLSVFNEQLEKSFTNDSVSRCPPISTQDLFGAASPFAFSTIKKRPEEPRRSSLRFALLQNNDEGLRAKNTLIKSPTPAVDRVPLKAKNVATPLGSFSGEKASQTTQDSLVDRSRRSIRDVEMTMSLGNSSLDSDVHFTNGFLHNLDEI